MQHCCDRIASNCHNIFPKSSRVKLPSCAVTGHCKNPKSAGEDENVSNHVRLTLKKVRKIVIRSPIKHLEDLSVRAFQIELEFRSDGFSGEGKTGVPGCGFDPGTQTPGPHWWEVIAVGTAQSLLPKLTHDFSFCTVASFAKKVNLILKRFKSACQSKKYKMTIVLNQNVHANCSGPLRREKKQDGQRMKPDLSSNIILASYLQTKQYSVTFSATYLSQNIYPVICILKRPSRINSTLKYPVYDVQVDD